MSRNYRLMFAVVTLSIVGGMSSRSAAADDPPAKSPAPQRGLGAFGGGMPGLFMLRSEVVQKDLQLTDEQKESITKLQEKAREEFSGLQGLSDEERRTKMQELRKNQEEKIAGILNDKQKARLKEIGLQQAGAMGLANKDVAEALKLSDDQVNKIKELTEAYQKEAREAFQSAAGGGDPTSARDAVTKLRKETNEKIMALLNADQKASFEKMQGEKIELPAGGFFGGGRPRGN
jgi:Spy/CpxP family protein refolding chaperone